MKLIRRRRPSLNTMLGITQAKRRIAKATGIPTTKAGRKRKALNALTGGGYGKYIKARAAVNRPFKVAKQVSGGCLVTLLQIGLILTVVAMLLFA